MDEPRGRYAERTKPVTEGQMLHDSTYEVSSRVKLIEAERRWLPGAGGRGQRGVAIRRM